MQALLEKILPFLLAAFVLGLYFLALSSPPLLDEQYLLSWLKEMGSLHGSSGISGFFLWPGFETIDSWGPVTKVCLIILSAIFGKSVFFFKLVLVLLHSFSCYLIYKIGKEISSSAPAALIAALVFACYPLHYETSAWLGGVGIQLASFFFLLAFNFFLNARKTKWTWLKLAVPGALSILAIMSSKAVWPFCFAFALYELCDLVFPKARKASKDPTMTLISILLPLLVVALNFAASGIDYAFVPQLNPGKIALLLKRIVFPVNELNWQKYSKQYVFLYFLYAPLMVSLLLSFCYKPELRRALLFAFLLLAVLSLSFTGLACTDSSLYGERFLYLASMPFALIAGIGLSGLCVSKTVFRIPSYIVSGLLSFLLILVFSRHLSNENAANRNHARILKSLQKSAKIVQEKEQLSLLIISDLPRTSSISPAFLPRGPVVLDAQKGLLRSNCLPDGRLKELLLAGKLKKNCWRWEKLLSSLLPIDLYQENSTLVEDAGIDLLKNRILPPIEYYKNAHLSEDGKVIELDSNSENGPMLTVAADELGSLDTDYIYLDAQINAPTSFAAPRIELHWQSRVHSDYDKNERFSYADAIVNDGKTHRYLLSLRRNGWTAGGKPTIIALGFPAGSNVKLRGFGIVKNSSEIAQLDPLTGSCVQDGRARYSPPYYNYPLEPDLGLLPLADNATEIEADYSVADINGAIGVSAELSFPDRSFDDANSNHLSGQTYKTFEFKGASGRLAIPISQLPGPGVYSLRVIGNDGHWHKLGQFSDPLCFSVARVKKGN